MPRGLRGRRRKSPARHPGRRSAGPDLRRTLRRPAGHQRRDAPRHPLDRRWRGTRARASVHIAPGAGEEDFRLGQDLGLEVLVPIDENGAYTAGYDWLTGRDAREVADDVVGRPAQNAACSIATTPTPTATPTAGAARKNWCSGWTTSGSSAPTKSASPCSTPRATVELDARVRRLARMADWLRNMGDWNYLPPPLLGPAAALLSLQVLRAPDR